MLIEISADVGGHPQTRFGVPNGLVATSEAGGGLVSEQIGSGEVKMAFEAPHDVERWDVRGRRGDVEIVRFTHSPVEEEESSETTGTFELTGNTERSVMLAVSRGGKSYVVDARMRFEEGDVVSIAIHTPEREDALRELARAGWHPIGDDAETAGAAHAAAADEEVHA